MLKTYIAAIVIVLIAACGSDSEDRTNGYSDTPKTTEDSLFQQVMDGHDEAMAKMGKLRGYSKQVDQKIDSLGKLKGSATRGILDAYGTLKNELTTAEAGMNKWMEDFKIDSAQDDIPKRIEYLEDEKKKVEQVREQILSVLSKADTLLAPPAK